MEYRIIGRSYACHTGGRAMFREGGVRIGVPEAPDGSRLLIGGKSYEIRGGSVRLPESAICTGINRVTLVIGGERLAAEGILSTGGGICPAGASLPEVVRALDGRIQRLEGRLERALSRIEVLESEEGLFA